MFQLSTCRNVLKFYFIVYYNYETSCTVYCTVWEKQYFYVVIKGWSAKQLCVPHDKFDY